MRDINQKEQRAEHFWPARIPRSKYIRCLIRLHGKQVIPDAERAGGGGGGGPLRGGGLLQGGPQQKTRQNWSKLSLEMSETAGELPSSRRLVGTSCPVVGLD